jgi:hypothetical protein
MQTYTQPASRHASLRARWQSWRDRPTLSSVQARTAVDEELQQEPSGSAPGDGDTPPPVRKPHKWRRRFKRVALVMAILMLPVGWSYYRALTGPGSDSLQARSVEWARDHHLGWLVDRVEKSYYASHQAKVGGTPSDAARVLHLVNEPSTTATSGTHALTGTTAPAATLPGNSATSLPQSSAGAIANPPLPLVSPASPPLQSEGQWSAFGPTVNGHSGAYATLLRPDSTHTSVLDLVAYFDPTYVSFRQYPGTKIPGAPWDRPDYVEPARLPSLIAAFDGGFRLKDSRGGMILGGHLLQPMRDGGATLIVDANGRPSVGMWGRDFNSSTPLDSARQNLDLLVDGGVVNPALATDANRTWGFTGPANKQAVWRSGAGITASGALVFVCGNGLTVSSLADLLIRAGAVRGMQLDINQEWVQFNTYTTSTSGAVTGQVALAGMGHSGSRYLSVDTRDFFAVFAR